ncbi:hypothetical protein AVDCRST_MAG81-563 [uncultured Synechococcales cyanobacterium]|uniref:DDE domain-containing protein n=1 Tax=uncultured Synechococcales cyanobacterium TaxID=1936017 RepID=A0A6J4UTJ9_9CYAN|nr:hypothetical protein AVDCRST_MAG81-563 [uncultured Synechococcales cyanobacterium]
MKKFLRKLLKQPGFTPRVLITDKLKSCSAAKRELLPRVEHRQHQGLNNRAEASHQPTRLREQRMQRFKSAGHAPQFLAAFELIRQYFHPKQHQLFAQEFRQLMHQRLETWRTMTKTQRLA